MQLIGRPLSPGPWVPFLALHKSRYAVHTSNISVPEMEGGGSEVQGNSQQYSGFEVSLVA